MKLGYNKVNTTNGIHQILIMIGSFFSFNFQVNETISVFNFIRERLIDLLNLRVVYAVFTAVFRPYNVGRITKYSSRIADLL